MKSAQINADKLACLPFFFPGGSGFQPRNKMIAAGSRSHIQYNWFFPDKRFIFFDAHAIDLSRCPAAVAIRRQILHFGKVGV